MNLQDHRIVLETVKELNAAGSWTGKTHIQKALALVLARRIRTLPFKFVLYKHGPFSFDLQQALEQMRSYCGLSFESGHQYGEKARPGENAAFLRERTQIDEDDLREIQEVCRFVGKRPVNHLERLATAAWIRGREEILVPDQIASRLNSLKPHISRTEALEAWNKVSSLFSQTAS